MDHHCTILGQCVGRKNMKYFLQYCLYMSLLLGYAMLKLIHLFYTQNAKRNIGIQGFTWFYLPTPFLFGYIFLYPVEEGGYDIYRTIDNMLFLACLAFFCFSSSMFYKVTKNLFENTSFVDQLKHCHNAKTRPNRSLTQVLKIVFGDSPSIFDYVLPTAPK